MKHEITRIEPMSAVRVGFFLGFVIGVLLGLLYGFMLKTLAASGQAAALPPEVAAFAQMNAVSVLFMAIMAGLGLSILHAILGAILAVAYNLIARLFGGFEYIVAEHAVPAESSSSVEAEEPDNSDD